MGGVQALLDYLRRCGFKNEGAAETFLEGALARKDWSAVAEVVTGAIQAATSSDFCQGLMPLGVEALRRTGNPQGALTLAERRFRLQQDTWSLLAWLSEGDATSWQERLTRLLADSSLSKATSRGDDRWTFIRTPWAELRTATRAKRLPWMSFGRKDREFTLLAAAALKGALPPKSRLLRAWHEAFHLEPWHHFGAPSLWKEPAPERTCADLLGWKLTTQPLSDPEGAACARNWARSSWIGPGAS